MEAVCGSWVQNGKVGLLHKMGKEIKYTIFTTRWGYFGLTGTSDALWSTSLPVSTRSKAEQILAGRRPQARYDSRLFIGLQERIRAYFGGECADFVSVPVDLGGFSVFSRKVLLACRNIPCGQTVSYAQLAQLAEAPKAVRAAASVMAKNPIPLIIPCHRIIRSDGSVGGFSAPGGRNLKERLLDLEAGNRLQE